MIIELFGLPGSGKTAIAEMMKTQGAILVPMPSRIRLISDASLLWLSHPILAFTLFVRIMAHAPRGMWYELFVNGIFGYAARYQRARALSRAGAVAVLDQGFFQLFISLEGLPLTLLKDFPRPDILVVVTTDVSVRERRMATRGWAPREGVSHGNRLKWQRNIEVAFHDVLPSLEKLVQVYRYDGTQNLKTGVVAFMGLTVKPAHTIVRVPSSRGLIKIVVLVASSLIAHLVRIFQRAPQVVVLMYHSIGHPEWKLAVTPEMFERQMKYLAKNGLAVPLADIVSYARGEKKLFAHAVAVTFDDGYRDALTTALPILERYRIPATVFVPSDMSVRTSPDGRPHLTEEELRAISRSPLITIGSHATSHRKFTELKLEEIQNEARESADELARITGERPRFFAYPFGARSAAAELVVRDVGYEAAFGITEGTIRSGDNLFRLKRVQIDSTMNYLIFRLRLTSAVDWNRRIVDLFRRA